MTKLKTSELFERLKPFVAEYVARTTQPALAAGGSVVIGGTPTSIEPDDATQEGVQSLASRSDHQHGNVTAAPTVNLSVASGNAKGVATSFARSDHSHAITSSSNPGGAAALLATSAAGKITLAELAVTGVGISSHLMPSVVDTYDIGSSTKLWRHGYLSELDTLLFAQQTITLLGGWFYITKDEGTWSVDLPNDDVNIDVDFGKPMAVGAYLVSRGALKVEYFKILAFVSGFTYTVDRNVDAGGTNSWPKGTPYAVLGQAGSGRIELNAYDTPRIQILIQGTNYNDQDELIRLGDLDGNWGFAAATYGIAIGKYASGYANLIYDPTVTTGGLKLRAYTADKIVLANDGSAYFAGVMTIGASGEIRQGTGTLGTDFTGLRIWRDTNVGRIAGYNNNILQWYGATDGHFYFGTGKMRANVSGLEMLATNAAGTAILTWKDGFAGSIKGFIYYDYSLGGNDQLTLYSVRDVWIQAGTGYIINLIGDLHVAQDTYLTSGLNVGAGGTVVPGSGDIVYASNLRPYRNSTQLTGYIFVPFTTNAKYLYDGTGQWSNASRNVGTYTFDLDDANNLLPTGVKAVAIRMTVKFATAADGNYAVAYTRGKANFPVVARSQVANISVDQSGVVFCADATYPNDMNVDIVGANATGCYMEAVGYFI